MTRLSWIDRSRIGGLRAALYVGAAVKLLDRFYNATSSTVSELVLATSFLGPGSMPSDDPLSVSARAPKHPILRSPAGDCEVRGSGPIQRSVRLANPAAQRAAA